MALLSVIYRLRPRRPYALWWRWVAWRWETYLGLSIPIPSHHRYRFLAQQLRQVSVRQAIYRYLRWCARSR